MGREFEIAQQILDVLKSAQLTINVILLFSFRHFLLPLKNRKFLSTFKKGKSVGNPWYIPN